MKRALIGCLLVACTHVPTQAAQVATTEGKLKDGTPYRIDMPERWNGAVLIGLDYASAPPGNPTRMVFFMVLMSVSMKDH